MVLSDLKYRIKENKIRAVIRLSDFGLLPSQRDAHFEAESYCRIALPFNSLIVPQDDRVEKGKVPPGCKQCPLCIGLRNA